jgi:acetoin utilization deacetylase AcuC-like enzyme
MTMERYRVTARREGAWWSLVAHDVAGREVASQSRRLDHAEEAIGEAIALVLDVDGHCGGGTASLISSIPGAEQLDISVHHYDSYASTDRCRLVMTDADRYLETLEDELERVVDPAGIDLVIHNAGMDIHEGAGGVSGIRTAVVAERERMIFDWARRHRLPVAWTLAGGYTSSGLALRQVAELHLMTAKAALAASD